MVGAAYESSIGCGYDEHTVPLRIKERLPTVRLVAILRDPVERARSHHLMASMNGLERRPFDEAIEELLQPGSLLRDRQSPSEDAGYVVWGEYGRILSGYFDVFPAEQILIVFTDELNAAPERLLHRVHEFIGVTPDIMPDNLGTRYREGSATRRFLGVDAYAAQGAVRRNRVTRFVWHALPEASRLWADRGFTHLAYRADLLNRRNGCDPEEPAASTLTRLRDHFARDSDLLATLLGDTPPWQQSEASA
jgi:GNAT superfamily N-acetyltransferase